MCFALHVCYARQADPLVRSAGGDKDDFPLASGQQVADDKIVTVSLEGCLGLVDEDF